MHSLQSALLHYQNEHSGDLKARSPVLQMVWAVNAVILKSSVVMTHCHSPAQLSSSLGVHVVLWVVVVPTLAVLAISSAI